MTMTHSVAGIVRRLRWLVPAVTIACGGGGGDGPTTPPPPPSTTPVATSIAVSGGDQVARIGQAIPSAPTVTVKDQTGKAMAGINVSFTVTAGGGSLAAASGVTDASGVAPLPTWTLGTSPGVNTVRASVSGGSNPSAQITATARPPRWTVLVYMAADNNLATSGVQDLEEMEAAGANPEVQVVAQGEFNPTAFGQIGLSPSVVHLPNYNTFRYTFGGLIPLAPSVLGPNGVVTDIGNRNMTDPAELRGFIQWGKATYPAEHYALVLWNHGGGYQGLLTDETSANGRMMSLADLKSALAGVGAIDMLDFDMCLMAGYETLEAVNGVAKTVAFSQEVEPGDGDPYTPILQALYQVPTMDGRALASTVVEKYNAYYVAEGRSSTTKSAYDLAGYAAFEGALNAVAQTLSASAPTLAPTVAASSRASQKFRTPMFTDIGDLMDSLGVRVASGDLKTQLAAVKSLAGASNFRLANRTFTGSGYGASSVSRATGLSLVLPGGASAADWFQPTGGPLSLAAYQAAMPNKAWTQFLGNYVAALTTPAATYVDQGTNRWEIYLVWDTASVSRNADVDLWVVEPNGNLFIPFLGTVTPNGAMSNDSYQDHTYFEAYMMNRYIQTGRYKFYANLWSDPQNHHPIYDFQSRQSPTAQLSSLYAPNYPPLSMQVSWLNDPSATFASVEAGNYTDLRYAAYLDIAAAAADRSPVASGGARMSLTASTEIFHLGELGAVTFTKAGRDQSISGPDVTQAQLRTVRANWARRMARRRAAQLAPGGDHRSISAPTAPSAP